MSQSEREGAYFDRHARRAWAPPPRAGLSVRHRQGPQPGSARRLRQDHRSPGAPQEDVPGGTGHRYRPGKR
jgi:hypothetical protein